MKYFSYYLIALSFAAAGVFVFPVTAQVSLTATGSVSTAYTQNFDTLPNSGSGFLPFIQNVTLPGWYASSTVFTPNDQIRVSDGSDFRGALYSFGVAGTNPIGDRSLGGVGANVYGSAAWGVRFVNNTNEEINSFTVTYTGELWRTATVVKHKLEFDYSVLSAPLITLPATQLVDGYNKVSELNFVDPSSIVANPIFVDGNAPSNRTLGITSTINVSVPPRSELVLRWFDLNDSGNDDGLGIDDLSFGYTTTFIPEPASISFFVLPTLLLVRRPIRGRGL
jgi:hypothetical protein